VKVEEEIDSDVLILLVEVSVATDSVVDIERNVEVEVVSVTVELVG
jgi:hypothetical protein